MEVEIAGSGDTSGGVVVETEEKSKEEFREDVDTKEEGAGTGEGANNTEDEEEDERDVTGRQRTWTPLQRTTVFVFF